MSDAEMDKLFADTYDAHQQAEWQKELAQEQRDRVNGRGRPFPRLPLGNLLLTAGILGAGFLFAPQVLSGTANSCHAMETALYSHPNVELSDFGRGLGSLVSEAAPGSIGRRSMRDEFPGVPPGISCAGFWYLLQIGR